MSIDSPTNLILQPEQHQQGVRLFFDHFQLSLKTPNLVFLEQIIEKFAEIPYENISKIIKLSQKWESDVKIRFPEEVLEDHISQKLGGTCFSLTFLLQSILTQQGFICYPVMAHMQAGRNIHCAMIVLVDGIKYLVDPGFLLNRPMSIEALTRRVFLREFGGVELRFDAESGYFNLFTFEKDESKWRYQFQDRPCPPDEFLNHWLASFTKPMMHGICLTKVTKEGLIYIHKDYMRQITYSEKKNFKLKKNLHATVHTIFGIAPELIENAQSAVSFNMNKEVELGLFDLVTRKRILPG